MLVFHPFLIKVIVIFVGAIHELGFVAIETELDGSAVLRTHRGLEEARGGVLGRGCVAAVKVVVRGGDVQDVLGLGTGVGAVGVGRLSLEDVSLATFVTGLGAERRLGHTTEAEACLSVSVPHVALLEDDGLGYYTHAVVAVDDGITEDAEAFFVFRSDAERLNGRAAMVGITAWALIEAVSGTAAL